MSQTFVSTVRWGRKTNSNSIKKAKGKLCRFITPPDALLLPGEVSSDQVKTCGHVEELQAGPEMHLQVKEPFFGT